MAISLSRKARSPNRKPPPSPPIMAPSGMKVKNTSIPPKPSKSVVLKISTQARPSPIPSAAPPSAPKTSPSTASNAIFMSTFRPQIPEMGRGGERSGSTGGNTRGADGGAPRGAITSAASAPSDFVDALAGQEIPLEHLLHQVERVHGLADFPDAAVAQREEHGDVELHGAAVAALPEERADVDRDLVGFGDDFANLVTHAGVAGVVAGVDGLPGFPHL